MLLILFLLISRHSMVTTSSGCHSGRNKDHLTLVSCVSQGLATVPDGIDPGTEVLILSQNAFVSLSWATYTTFTRLHELDLSQNLISTINQSGPVLENLRVLRLSDNKLTVLGGATFKPTPSLMEIYLDGNTISSLDSATFSGLPLLELINLSRNKLHILPPRLLERISSSNLKTFDLEENCVQHLPDEFFASKTELPYVFLSNNSWVCTCQVSYLNLYLNDQSHNVYIHTGPSSIENGPESVLCSAPPTLKGRAIIDLKEEEYCSSDHSSAHMTQILSAPTTALTATIIQPKVITTVILATAPTAVQPTMPKTAESSTVPIPTSLTTNNSTTITPTTTEPTTLINTIPTTTTPRTTPITAQPAAPTTTDPTTPTTTTPRTTLITAQPAAPTTTDPTTPTTTTPRTTPITAQPAAPTTTDPTTPTTSTPRTTPITAQPAAPTTTDPTTPTTTTPRTTPITAQPAAPTTTDPTTPTTTTPRTTPITAQPAAPTTTDPTTPTTSTPRITQKMTPRPTPMTAESSNTPIPSAQTTNNPTTIKSVTTVTGPAGGVLLMHGSQRSVPWCWWLFITVLLLCIFSANFSCMLFIWLIITYIKLYQPIKRQARRSLGVALRAYRVTADKSLTEDRTEEEKVLFLPPEMIRETQPVFRSVLFISNGEADERRTGRRNEDEEKKRGTDTTTKIDLLPAVTLHREQGTETRDREEVFRKTLHRVISREEEIEGWEEVEEETCWGMMGRDKERREGGMERGKTRYSLILREERGSVMEGRAGETEWLVGEWEMRGGGQGSCRCLIRMKEGWDLSDSAHTETPEPEAEASV